MLLREYVFPYLNPLLRLRISTFYTLTYYVCSFCVWGSFGANNANGIKILQQRTFTLFPGHEDSDFFHKKWNFKFWEYDCAVCVS